MGNKIGMASADQQREGGEGRQTAAERNQQGGQPESPVALPIEQPPGQPEAAIANQQAQTEQPAPHVLRDLIAQEDMAFWAMAMFFAAVATFIVTSLGTILIWRQVKLTRQAVEDTGEATEAMREANRIAERIGTAQARAFLSIAAESFTFDQDGWFDVAFRAVNSGQSPARKVHVRIEASLVDAGKPRTVATTIRGIGDLAVGGSGMAALEIDCSPKMRQQLLAGTSLFRFDVEVDYDTVFEGTVGKDNFVFEGFVLDDFQRLILQPLPRQRMLRVHGRKRERRKQQQANHDASPK